MWQIAGTAQPGLCALIAFGACHVTLKFARMSHEYYAGGYEYEIGGFYRLLNYEYSNMSVTSTGCYSYKGTKLYAHPMPRLCLVRKGT